MLPANDDAPTREYPVFIKPGDARHEVEQISRALRATPAEAGLHKSIFAAQANQTVVMVTARDTPLANGLRSAGWLEPREPAES
jgi:hypothetical protein